MLRTILLASALACTASLASAQAPAATTTATTVAPPPLEICGLFVSGANSASSYIPISGFSVINAEPPLSVRTGEAVMQAVVCDRHSIFVSPRDFRVITDLHVPLYVRNEGRMMALELTGGRFRARFTHGAPTDAERSALVTSLDATQTAYAAYTASQAHR